MNRVIIGILAGITIFVLNSPKAHADMCPLAKEMAAKSVKAFDSDQKEGLSGLIQALKYCPDDQEIAYNLGLAYYRYERPDMAYKIWAFGPSSAYAGEMRGLRRLGPSVMCGFPRGNAGSWSFRNKCVSKLEIGDESCAGV